jgi:hypothetical protein
MTMLPHVHRRDPDKLTRALCGAGYDWPSGISLTDDPTKVTCPSCPIRPVLMDQALARLTAKFSPRAPARSTWPPPTH